MGHCTQRLNWVQHHPTTHTRTSLATAARCWCHSPHSTLPLPPSSQAPACSTASRPAHSLEDDPMEVGAQALQDVAHHRHRLAPGAGHFVQIIGGAPVCVRRVQTAQQSRARFSWCGDRVLLPLLAACSGSCGLLLLHPQPPPRGSKGGPGANHKNDSIHSLIPCIVLWSNGDAAWPFARCCSSHRWAELPATAVRTSEGHTAAAPKRC